MTYISNAIRRLHEEKRDFYISAMSPMSTKHSANIIP